MAAITADMVKTLREKTGAGMMDCKRALEEAAGNLETAVDNLRKSGAAKAEKKANRATKEGLVFPCITATTAALAEVVAETDFVVRNERFQAYGPALVKKIAAMTAEGDLTATLVEQEKAPLTEMIATIGENIQIRRALRWTAKDGGTLASYTHMGGKIVVLAEIAGEAAPGVAADVCMHIAAFNPQFIVPENIPAAIIAKEREIAAAQVLGKPANMVEKIVDGKINKWYSEVCLTRQPWLRDDKTCLAKVAPALVVRRFVRWQVGEEV